jgi:hypothetical protein
MSLSGQAAAHTTAGQHLLREQGRGLRLAGESVGHRHWVWCPVSSHEQCGVLLAALKVLATNLL